MKKLILIFVVAILALSCNKESEEENDVKINIIVNDSILYNGVKTEISANVNQTVEAITFYIDGKNIGSISESNFSIEYTPKNLKAGNHILKCTATSLKGKIFKNEKTIKCVLRLGDTFEGGNIFHLGKSGEHGLISSNEDFAANSNNGELTEFQYGCYNKFLEAKSEDGKLNTSKMAENSTNQNEIGYYFKTELTYNGYSDWYIPSEMELNLLRDNMQYVEGFIYDQNHSMNNYYWSSTEAYLYEARALNMFVMAGNQQDKLKYLKVRLIRKF